MFALFFFLLFLGRMMPGKEWSLPVLHGPGTPLTCPMHKHLQICFVLRASWGLGIRARLSIRELCLRRQEYSGSVTTNKLVNHATSFLAMAAGDVRDYQAVSCRGEKRWFQITAMLFLCAMSSGPMLYDFQLLITKFSRTCNGVTRWYVYIG